VHTHSKGKSKKNSCGTRGKSAGQKVRAQMIEKNAKKNRRSVLKPRIKILLVHQLWDSF
jgi:hypothetical protein